MSCDVQVANSVMICTFTVAKGLLMKQKSSCHVTADLLNGLLLYWKLMKSKTLLIMMILLNMMCTQ